MGEGNCLTAKEFLQQYYQINCEIDALLEDVSNLRRMTDKTIQTLTCEKMQVPSESVIESILTKIMNMEKEADEKIDKLKQIKDEIVKVITQIPDTTCQNVLFRRYICGHTWEKIAVDMHYNY